ncbi:MAG TPA: hypothetical protein VIS99_09500 [Terrimicrobiaceae bacterium]
MVNLPTTTVKQEPEIDWSLTTWKGSRRQQHQAHLALPFRRKIELIEEMCDQGRAIFEERQLKGLPYLDPYSHKVVAPRSPLN